MSHYLAESILSLSTPKDTATAKNGGSVSSAPAASPLIANFRKASPEKPALFFVHPIGGGVNCYAALEKYLNPDWSFHGIRAIGLDDDTPPFRNLTSMACCYVQSVRQVQPAGPYFLGGWSMGGVVAYEMALQLGQSDIGGLVLIDSPAPTAHPRDPVLDFSTFTKGLGFFPEQVKDLCQSLRFQPASLPVQLIQLLEKGQRMGILPQSLTSQALQQLYTVFIAHSEALSHYTAEPISKPVPALLVQAQSVDNPLLDMQGTQASTCWNALLGRSLMSRILPGDHYTLVTEPHVGILSTYVNAFLRQIGPRSAVSRSC